MAGRDPSERIFPGLNKKSLLAHVARICVAAGVRAVCTHGLRGTNYTMTLVIEERMASTARSLGHGGLGVGRSHYLMAGAEASARAAMMERLLFAPAEDASEIEVLEYEIASANARLATLRAHPPAAPAELEPELGTPISKPIPRHLKLVG